MLPPSKALPAVQAPSGTPVKACAPAGLHRHMCSRPASGADKRDTCRGGADTAGPETYLEVLEGLGSWGRQGLAVVHRGGKDTDSGGIRKFFITFILFLKFFYSFNYFFLVLILFSKFYFLFFVIVMLYSVCCLFFFF